MLRQIKKIMFLIFTYTISRSYLGLLMRLYGSTGRSGHMSPSSRKAILFVFMSTTALWGHKALEDRSAVGSASKRVTSHDEEYAAVSIGKNELSR